MAGADRKRNRLIHINASHAEYDGLFAYAESQGMKPNQAAAELLLASIANNATSAQFIAASRSVRAEVQRIIISEAIKSVAYSWERLRERAMQLGIDVEPGS